MNRLIIILLTGLIISACGTRTSNDHPENEAANISLENMVVLTYNVEGMTCEGCENAIMKSIESLEGIAEVISSHNEGWTKVSFDKTATSPDEIKEKIADAGYTVIGIKEE